MTFQGLHGDVFNRLGVLAEELLGGSRDRDIVALDLDLRDAINPHRHAFAGINILLLLHIDGQQLQRKDIDLFVHRPNEHASSLDNAEPDIASGSVSIGGHDSHLLGVAERVDDRVFREDVDLCDPRG